MRAIALEVSETRALVQLRPCWFARLLGARTTVLALMWERVWASNKHDWHAVATHRPLDELSYRAEIRDALDFRPVGKLPEARLR